MVEERFTYLPIRRETWEYSGEYQKHCEECGLPIEEGDRVVIEPFIYKGNSFMDIWHAVCFSEEMLDGNSEGH